MTSLAEQSCYTLIANPQEGDFPNDQDLKQMLGMYVFIGSTFHKELVVKNLPFYYNKRMKRSCHIGFENVACKVFYILDYQI